MRIGCQWVDGCGHRPVPLDAQRGAIGQQDQQGTVGEPEDDHAGEDARHRAGGLSAGRPATVGR